MTICQSLLRTKTFELFPQLSMITLPRSPLQMFNNSMLDVSFPCCCGYCAAYRQSRVSFQKEKTEEWRRCLYSDESMLGDPEQSYKRKMLIDSCIRSFVVVQLAMRYLFAKGFADRRSVGGPEGLGHLHESVFVNVANDDGPSVRPCKGHDVHQSMLAGG